MAVSALALLLLMVTVPMVVPPVVIDVGDSAKVMVGAAVAALMLMVMFWVALGDVPLAAWMVKVNAPAVVGVPFNIPLAALRVRPAGKVPEATLQVMGVVPLAVKVWL